MLLDLPLELIAKILAYVKEADAPYAFYKEHIPKPLTQVCKCLNEAIDFSYLDDCYVQLCMTETVASAIRALCSKYPGYLITFIPCTWNGSRTRQMSYKLSSIRNVLDQRDTTRYALVRAADIPWLRLLAETGRLQLLVEELSTWEDVNPKKYWEEFDPRETWELGVESPNFAFFKQAPSIDDRSSSLALECLPQPDAVQRILLELCKGDTLPGGRRLEPYTDHRMDAIQASDWSLATDRDTVAQIQSLTTYLAAFSLTMSENNLYWHDYLAKDKFLELPPHKRGPIPVLSDLMQWLPDLEKPGYFYRKYDSAEMEKIVDERHSEWEMHQRGPEPTLKSVLKDAEIWRRWLWEEDGGDMTWIEQMDEIERRGHS